MIEGTDFIPDHKWDAHIARQQRLEFRQQRLEEIERQKKNQLEKQYSRQNIAIEQQLDNLDEVFA